MRNTQNIVLIGAMGVGKSTLAPMLARILGCPWTDTDDLITSHGMSGAEIIQHHGIEEFRAIETVVVCNVLRNRPGVVATGAGAWTIPEVRAQARDSSLSIWLKADAKTLAGRLYGSDRYLVRTGNPEEIARQQIRERNGLYALADITISADGAPERTVQLIIQDLNIVLSR